MRVCISLARVCTCVRAHAMVACKLCMCARGSVCMCMCACVRVCVHVCVAACRACGDQGREHSVHITHRQVRGQFKFI